MIITLRPAELIKTHYQRPSKATETKDLANDKRHRIEGESPRIELCEASFSCWYRFWPQAPLKGISNGFLLGAVPNILRYQFSLGIQLHESYCNSQIATTLSWKSACARSNKRVFELLPIMSDHGAPLTQPNFWNGLKSQISNNMFIFKTLNPIWTLQEQISGLRPHEPPQTVAPHGPPCYIKFILCNYFRF